MPYSGQATEAGMRTGALWRRPCPWHALGWISASVIVNEGDGIFINWALKQGFLLFLPNLVKGCCLDLLLSGGIWRPGGASCSLLLAGL